MKWLWETNIIIEYDYFSRVKDHLTKNPVLWSIGASEVRSNYKSFIHRWHGTINFDYHNLEYIEDLIYVLADSQKRLGREHLCALDTWNAYQEIYSKH